MPRSVPSRLIIQSSTAACSPPMAASRRIQKTLHPKWSWAESWSNSRSASPVSDPLSKLSSMIMNTSTSLGSNLSVTNEPNDKSRQMAGLRGDMVNPLQSQRQQSSSRRASSETCHDLGEQHPDALLREDRRFR